MGRSGAPLPTAGLHDASLPSSTARCSKHDGTIHYGDESAGMVLHVPSGTCPRSRGREPLWNTAQVSLGECLLRAHFKVQWLTSLEEETNEML